MGSSVPGQAAVEEGLTRWFDPAVHLLDRVLAGVLALALIVQLAAVIAHVIARVFFNTGLLWTDEITVIAISVLTFMGGALAYHRGGHTVVNIAVNLMSPKFREVLSIALEALVMIASAPIALSAARLVSAQWGQSTQQLQLPVGLISLPLVIGMGLVILFSALRLMRRDLRLSVPVVAAVGVLVWAVVSFPAFQQLSGDAPMYTMLVFFFATVLLGLPVGFALMISAALYLQISGAIPLIAVAQNMASSAQHYVLMALPFFLLAGFVMEHGGISSRFVRFAAALVGHLPGGLNQVVVVATYLVSGISGSKVADVAAVGSVMRDSLVRKGYTPAQIAAVLAASAAMAETVPPSLAMLVLAAITSVSIGALLMAGLLPAAALAICLMALIYWRARRSGENSGERAAWSEVLISGAGALLPLMMPVMLMLGIRFGLATPTEISGIAVVFGLVLAVGFYRELSWQQFLNCAVDCAIMAGMVLYVLSSASAFAWTLTIADLPQRIAAGMAQLHGGNVLLYMVMTIILVILVSCLLEGLPALLIMAPLLMPVAVSLGIDPVHYAIVLLVATAIGVFIPPIGIAFLITCGVARAPVGAAAREMRPFLIVLVLGLLLLAMVPEITLFLPRLTEG